MERMPSPRDVLVAIQRHEFQSAASLDKNLLLLQLATSLSSVASQFLPANGADVVAAVILLVLIAGAFFLTLNIRTHRALAEKARRNTVLVDGLGLQFSELELKRMLNQSKLTPAGVSTWNDPQFFK